MQRRFERASVECLARSKKCTCRQLVLFIGLVSACSIVVHLSLGLRGRTLTFGVYFHAKACVSIRPPGITDLRPNEEAIAEEKFRPLLTTSNNGSTCILVFSAYLDERSKTVQILTDVDRACDNITAIKAHCLIWYRDRGEPYATTFRFHHFATSHPNRAPRVGVVYGCDIHPSHTSSPYAVSVLAIDGELTTSDVTTVRISSYSSVTPMITFAVCTPPLFGKTRPQEIAEFVEIHRLLGAEMFFFYNVSTPPSVAKLLATYVADGIVKIVQFQPVYPDKVRYNNQAIMQLDCMYRNRGKARYVAQMDIDEILMPRENYTNWTSLTTSKFKKTSAALIFLNRFFALNSSLHCPARHGSGLPDGMPSSLKRLSYYDTYYPNGVRSKFIYSPERVKLVGIHYVVPLSGYTAVVLNATDDGVLHHYRGSLPPSQPSLNITSVDRRACAFSYLLLKQLSARLAFT